MFDNRYSMTYNLSRGMVQNKLKIPLADVDRIMNYEHLWRMYRGEHWYGMEQLEKAETTINYCRTLVDKFTAFELGRKFTIKVNPALESHLAPLLNSVWDDMNSKEVILEMHGQIKNVCGKVWHRVDFVKPTYKNFSDPYEEYPKGYFKITPMLPSIIFPEYDVHDKKKLNKLTVAYSYSTENNKEIVFKQVWTKDRVVEYLNETQSNSFENEYKVIPFFECVNLGVAGNTEGQSDLEDIIPINIELNLKTSDISEIIDYHASPVTVVYGAYADELDKGANKVWSGLPKDAKVENLSLQGDLSASREFLKMLKEFISIVGKVPAISIGEGAHISNTSGVALETIFSPIMDTVVKKRGRSAQCFSEINKYVIFVALKEGLLEVPEGLTMKHGDEDVPVTRAMLFKNEIIFGETLAKDGLVELQKIQIEMKLGLENREGAMKRLNKADIATKLAEIDAERLKYPDIYNINDGESIMQRGIAENNEGGQTQVNAGLQNSPEPKN